MCAASLSSRGLLGGCRDRTVHADADRRAMAACPWLFGVTISCISALVLLKSPLTSSLSWPVSTAVACLVFVVTVALAHVYAVPMIRWRSACTHVGNRCDGRVVELPAPSGVPNTTRLHHASKAFRGARGTHRNRADAAAPLTHHAQRILSMRLRTVS